MDHIVITRADAKAAGLTRYFSGKACPHGHVVERMVSTYACCACKLAKTTLLKRRRAILARGSAASPPGTKGGELAFLTRLRAEVGGLGEMATVAQRSPTVGRR